MITEKIKNPTFKIIIEYFLLNLYSLILLFITRKISYIFGSYHLFLIPNHELFLIPFLHSSIYILLSRKIINYLLVWFVIMFILIIHDWFWGAYNTIPKIQDLTLLPELFSVAPFSLLAFLLPVVILIYLLFQIQCKSWVVWLPVGIIGIAIVLIYIKKNEVISLIESKGMIVEWSSSATVIRSGRLIPAIYYHLKYLYSREHLKKDYSFEELSFYLDNDFKKTLKRTNIHIVLMESFLNPLWFQYGFDKKNELRDLLPKKLLNNMEEIISPVFGGMTSKAEFEILCGTPALDLIGINEFLIMEGGETYCLPSILKSIGYKTIVTYPYLPSFYNANKAYDSIGFVEKNFAMDVPNHSTYLKQKDVIDGYMFDGELFRQNYSYITKQPGPILNYIVGVYGHYPFTRDNVNRPNVFENKDFSNELNNISNQFVYRMNVLEQYIEKISKEGDSLIIVVSDHLPLLKGHSAEEYAKLGYLKERNDSLYINQLYLIRNGVFIKPPKYFHHYDILSFIFNSLSDGKYCQRYPCNFLNNLKKDVENDYKILLSGALKK